MSDRRLDYDDARRFLREADADLEAVRQWPPDRPGKLDWERSCFARRESLRKLVRTLAAGAAERAEAEQLTASR